MIEIEILKKQFSDFSIIKNAIYCGLLSIIIINQTADQNVYSVFIPFFDFYLLEKNHSQNQLKCIEGLILFFNFYLAM